MVFMRWLVRWPVVMVARALPQSTQDLLWADVRRWGKELFLEQRSDSALLLRLFARATPEFRNLYYYRLRRSGLQWKVVAVGMAHLWRPESTLYIKTESIGPGLFIQHGFASILAAESIGANCWINQQVTLGHVYNRGAPVIEDDVIISAGAVIVGPIRIHKGAQVGANTTVVKDVPAGAVAVGGPTRILHPGEARGDARRKPASE